MERKDLISIIIPVYNGERFIVRCLDSIKNQTYEEIEIIVVDDGSIDNSYSILLDYQRLDNRMKVFSKPNGGVSSARNFGLERANGSYVMFVDIDDFVDSTLCEKMYAYICQGFDFVVCGYYKIEKDRCVKVLPADDYENDSIFQHQFRHLLDHAAIYTPWGKLFKMQLIEKKFNTERSMGEDLEFNIEYFKSCNQLCWVNEPLYYYDTTVESALSKKLESSVNSDVQLCNIIEEFMKEKKVDYPDFNRKYYEKFRLYLQRAYEQRYTYGEFKALYMRLLVEGGYLKVSESKTTKGTINKITRFSIRHKIPCLVYMILFFKKSILKKSDT